MGGEKFPEFIWWALILPRHVVFGAQLLTKNPNACHYNEDTRIQAVRILFSSVDRNALCGGKWVYSNFKWQKF